MSNGSGAEEDQSRFVEQGFVEFTQCLPRTARPGQGATLTGDERIQADPNGRDRFYTYQNVYAVRSLGVEAALEWLSPGRYLNLDGSIRR